MTWQSGGGGGTPLPPGFSGDGQTPGGVIIDGAITAGSNINAGLPTFHTIKGGVITQTGQSSIDDPQTPFSILQSGDMSGDIVQPALRVARTINRNGFNAFYPALYVLVEDLNGSVPDEEIVTNFGNFLTNFAGGIGLFGAGPPIAPSSITGALSAIADPAAKAVLTSVIAALTADGGATDGTT